MGHHRNNTQQLWLITITDIDISVDSFILVLSGIKALLMLYCVLIILYNLVTYHFMTYGSFSKNLLYHYKKLFHMC